MPVKSMVVTYRNKQVSENQTTRFILICILVLWNVNIAVLFSKLYDKLFQLSLQRFNYQYQLMRSILVSVCFGFFVTIFDILIIMYGT